MKTGIALLRYSVAVLVVAVLLGTVLTPVPVHANQVPDDTGGEVLLDPTTDGGAKDHDGDGTADDPGYEADPDSFQIDSWAGAVLVEVERPAPRVGTGFVRGLFGWIAEWMRVIAAGHYGYLGSGW